MNLGYESRKIYRTRREWSRGARFGARCRRHTQRPALW